MSMNSYPLFIFLGVRGSKGPNIANIHMLVLFPEDRPPLCHRAATWSLIWLRESARVETWPLTGCLLLLDDHEVSWGIMDFQWISHGFAMDFPDTHGFYAVSWLMCPHKTSPKIATVLRLDSGSTMPPPVFSPEGGPRRTARPATNMREICCWFLPTLAGL